MFYIDVQYQHFRGQISMITVLFQINRAWIALHVLCAVVLQMNKCKS